MYSPAPRSTMSSAGGACMEQANSPNNLNSQGAVATLDAPAADAICRTQSVHISRGQSGRRARMWSSEDDFEAEVSKQHSTTGLLLIDRARQCARTVVKHAWFDASMSIFIILNMICIAVEQEYLLAGVETPTLKLLEHAFVCVYVLELGLRFFAGGRSALHDPWVKFDLVIVCVSVGTQWLPVVEHFGEMRLVVVMRLARLARLARAVRLIVAFRELWILVNGCLASAGIMFYTCALILWILFCFGLVGVELIAIRHGIEGTFNPAVDRVIAEHFDGLGPTMLTLSQFVTLDSIAAMYRPLVRTDPVLAIYFFSMILCIGIVLMNLITAVCVNGALEQAEQNKEASRAHVAKLKKKAIKELHDVFTRIDTHGNGMISLEDILKSTVEEMDHIRSYVKNANIEEVFNVLDVDGDDALDVEEFCEGLWQSMFLPTPLDFRRIDKRVHGINLKMRDLEALQRQLLSRLDQVGAGCAVGSSTLPAHCHATRGPGMRRDCPSTDNLGVPKHWSPTHSPRSLQAGTSSPESQCSTKPCTAHENPWLPKGRPCTESLEAPALVDDVLGKLQDVTLELGHRLAAAGAEAPTWVEDILVNIRRSTLELDIQLAQACRQHLSRSHRYVEVPYREYAASSDVLLMVPVDDERINPVRPTVGIGAATIGALDLHAGRSDCVPLHDVRSDLHSRSVPGAQVGAEVVQTLDGI